MAGETIRICRRETFNAAHRLYRKDWTDEKNFEVFGKCSFPNYHGHNYVIEVWLEGPIDPITGYLMDLKLLKAIIKTEICDRYDHKNFNLDCEEFKDRIPTAENIAVVCWKRIKPQLPANLTLEVVIHETEKNKVAYKGG